MGLDPPSQRPNSFHGREPSILKTSSSDLSSLSLLTYSHLHPFLMPNPQLAVNSHYPADMPPLPGSLSNLIILPACCIASFVHSNFVATDVSTCVGSHQSGLHVCPCVRLCTWLGLLSNPSMGLILSNKPMSTLRPRAVTSHLPVSPHLHEG